MLFDANTIEQVSRLIAEYTTGSKITNILENLHIRPADDWEKDTKWRRLHNAVVNSQNLTQDGKALIKLIEYIMAPINFHAMPPAQYAEIITSLNKLLILTGLSVNEAGKVILIPKASTLSEAQIRTQGLLKTLEPFQIHPQILRYCHPEFLQENYFHLIFEASKCLLEELRIISKLDKDGNTLINECFDGNSPLVVCNRLETADEKEEHKGLKALLNHIVYWYRNPKAHNPKFFSVDSKLDAATAVIIISKARYLLDRCTRNPLRK